MRLFVLLNSSAIFSLARAQAQGVESRIDPQAVALLNKTVATYNHSKALRLTLNQIEFGGNKPTGFMARVIFRRPFSLELERHWKKKPFSKRVTQTQVSSTLQMKHFANPVGEFLSNWLTGNHFLEQEAQKYTFQGATRFYANYFAPQSRPFENEILGQQVVEGIRVSAWYGKVRPDSVFFWEHVLWFHPQNGELVRIQSRTIGTKFRREVSFNVSDQSFDLL